MVCSYEPPNVYAYTEIVLAVVRYAVLPPILTLQKETVDPGVGSGLGQFQPCSNITYPSGPAHVAGEMKLKKDNSVSSRSGVLVEYSN